MSNDFDRNQWAVDHATSRFQEQAETMANRLRQMADEIERDANRILTDADRKYADEINRASWIVNSINFTFANLSTQDLIVRAAELKTARDTVETDEA